MAIITLVTSSTGAHVTLSPSTASFLSVTSTGKIKAGQSLAPHLDFGVEAVSLASATIRNSGSIMANSTAPAYDAGIYLRDSGATIVNTGFIFGNAEAIDDQSYANVTISNTGRITGGSAIAGVTGVVLNAGAITGAAKAGIYLQTGSVTNTGTISGPIGVYLGQGIFSNSGLVAGTAFGVELAGGYGLNVARITGGTGYGVAIGQVFASPLPSTQSASFVNYGTITGAEAAGVGLGGHLVNQASLTGAIGLVQTGGTTRNAGHIAGTSLGARLTGGYLDNYGVITGGVSLALATLENTGGITGATIGVAQASGLLKNSGAITGTKYGVVEQSGTLINYGVISSADIGVTIQSGILQNSGTITGAAYAVRGAAITLAITPGAAFSGKVQNATGKGMLQFEGAGQGTLSGIGTSIIGFTTLDFSAGDIWTIEGNIAGLATGETLANLQFGDRIVLDDFTAASKTFTAAGLILTSGTATETLDIGAALTTANFTLTEAAGNTTITIACFLAGTRIATPHGEVPVERLKIGDRVTTLNGPQPIKWIGRGTHQGADKSARPIRIKAGAIAENIPARDLYVSPGHAISIDGALIHAGLLVNNVSILQPATSEKIQYYHIELARHEILFAESCPAESFMNEAFRRQFHNAAEFHCRYPAARAPSEPCQPFLHHGFALHEIQRRLAARARIPPPAATGALRGYVDQSGPRLCIGWAQHVLAPEEPVPLEIRTAGRRIGRVLANRYREDVRAAGHGSGHHGFEFLLPPGAAAIEIRRETDAALLPPVSKKT